ncbi:hypothetical protein [Microbacterium sp. 3J1]|uniref:hypothetical protein n=1 Tax=Microbacterium sp. 3J1 TaxID=861269 RepID=UPI000A7B88A0|nr:hypothetical protein [Microbacterium sp. 3J1]
MSDSSNTQDADGTSDETPMIPDELVGRQTSDDPVANDEDATGPAQDNRRDADDEDDDRIDLNDLA